MKFPSITWVVQYEFTMIQMLAYKTKQRKSKIMEYICSFYVIVCQNTWFSVIKTPTYLHESEKNVMICRLIAITGTKEQKRAEWRKCRKSKLQHRGAHSLAPRATFPEAQIRTCIQQHRGAHSLAPRRTRRRQPRNISGSRRYKHSRSATLTNWAVQQLKKPENTKEEAQLDVCNLER